MVLVCYVILQDLRDQRVMGFSRRESLKVSHHSTKFGDAPTGLQPLFMKKIP